MSHGPRMAARKRVLLTRPVTGNLRVGCAHSFDIDAKVVRVTTVPPLVKADLLPIADE
jgi:hypothetical protein